MAQIRAYLSAKATLDAAILAEIDIAFFALFAHQSDPLDDTEFNVSMMTMIVGGIESIETAEDAAALLIQKSLDTHAERYFSFTQRRITEQADTPCVPP